MFSRRDRASELKQAGAVEAARDPQSTVTSEDAERVMVEETKKAGGAAYQFDPNATPEEKAAQARARVPEGFHHDRKPRATGVVSDVDDGTTAGYDLPPPSKAGAMALPEPGAAGKDTANGHLTGDDRWARDRTGWEPRFGQGNPADDEGPTQLEYSTWVEGQLDEKFYGDWYYNAAVIVFATLSTYVTTLLGGGLAWMFIVMAFCATYYRTSLRRVRRNFRDDIRREMAKTKLETDHESLEWINSFLVKFWPIYAPVLCDTIISSVDQVLSTSCPAFLDSLRMKTFILGTKPPRMEHVRTYPKTEDSIVMMDWKFSFNPNDTADLTARQLKNKINPKVVLEIRIGKGMISKGLDVIVEDFAFSGTMRIKCKLQIPFPHIEKVEVSFLGRPEIDYVCKPLGGDTFGFDINFIPGLESFIQEQIHANLEPIMYDPHVFPIEIAKMLAGSAVDQAIGVVQITLHGGQGLKNPDKFPGTPDPYAIVSIDNRDSLGKTKTIKENGNPNWNETINVIVTSLTNTLTVAVFDFNEYRKDKQLGIASFALDRLEHEMVHENMQIEVMDGGRARGVITADVRFFPVLEGEKMPDGTTHAVPESNTGIAKFHVEQAKELDGSKSLVGQLSPYAVLLLNGKEVQTSQILKRTNNPIWPDASKELLITDRKSAKLGLVVKDDRGLSADPIVGTYQIKMDDMLDLTAKGQEWYQLAGVTTGRAKMSLQWKPVALKGAAAGSGGYITPIGVMRLHFRRARELRNLETLGKSDPYVRVLLSGIEKGRTVTHQNNLNPEFDEIIYIPIHSTREKLTLEVMDEESLGKDRPLGLTELAAAGYIREDENGEYLAHEEKRERSEPLKLSGKGSTKGFLEYTCAFYPTYNVADPDDDEEEDDVDARKSFESAVATRSDRSGTISSLKPTQAEANEAEMANQLAQGEKDQEETTDPQKPAPPKLRIGPEDLTKYESGLLIFRVIDTDLARSDVNIEVLMDDYRFPSFRSSRVRSRQSTLNETGDAMVRELDVSRITIRLREKGGSDSGEDHIYAKLAGNTLDVLKKHLYQTMPLTLKGDDGRDSRITVQVKYLPIKMELDPSESINNMGIVRCDILDAAELPAADRNGFSDPYCKFILNGAQVFKTQTQKKTLHPAWNEFFETPVSSRTAAAFKVECWDWDRGDKDDLLGTAEIKLDALEAFQAQELTLALDGKSGLIRLKLLFKPDYVTRQKIGSSTFSGTFALPGKVVGAPVKGVAKGASFIGGGVGRGASLLTRGFRKRKTDIGTEAEEGDESTTSRPTSSSPNALSAPQIVRDSSPPATPTHIRETSNGTQSPISPMHKSPAGAPETGTASFTVVSALGYEGDHVRVYIKQQVGKTFKEIHKTAAVKASADGPVSFDEPNETVKANCNPDTPFTVAVRDVHTFGKDVELGEGSIPLTLGDQEVKCGNGVVVVRVGFTQLLQADGASLVESVGADGKSRLRRNWLSSRNSRDGGA